MSHSPRRQPTGVEVAVRGAGLGPVRGIVIGTVAARGRFARPDVALAVRRSAGDEWTPLAAPANQILMTWERWCKVRRAALAGHPWPAEAIRRVVELVPEGTRRLAPPDAIGERCAFVVDASKAMHAIATTLLDIAGFSVETFDTPVAAAQRSIERRPDVIVMEPRSPGINALATMRVLRQRFGDQATPVIWCTTDMPTLEQVHEGARLGLRGVILKPLRLEALTAMVLRVCRDAQREHRLLALGVDAGHIASRSLDCQETMLWARVEVELGAEAVRPLSFVWVGSNGGEAMSAVRGTVRAGDMIGRAGDGTLMVLLPDVGQVDAVSIAARVARAVSGMEHPPAVGSITRRPTEDAVALLTRHHAEMAERRQAPATAGR